MQIFSNLDKKQSIKTCHEIELLLCCARTHLNSPTTERIKTLLQQDINWEYLIPLASRHGVMALLYWSIKNTCPESIPQVQLDQLRQYFQFNTYNNLILTQELINLLRLFETNKIPALPFKGPVLAASVYRNLSLRRITDLDILVHKQDFQKAVDLLTEQGYQLAINVPWESHLVRDDGISNVDLHPIIAPKHLCCSISDNFWWEHLESFSLAGTIMPNLSPEALVVMLCLNGTKECWQSLNRICDVAELIRAYPGMDWSQIMAQAHRLKYKRLISLALLLTGNLLEAPIPEAVWEQVQCDSVANSLAIQVSKQLFSETTEPVGEVERTLFHIKTRERLQEKVQSFLGLMGHSGWLTPTEKDLDFLYLPAFLSWLYYVIRPIRVLRKYGLSSFRQLLIHQ